MKTDPQQITPAGFVSPEPPPATVSAWDGVDPDQWLADVRGQDRGQGEGDTLAKYQPCGCIICTCEDEIQCHGCGAKYCGTHPTGSIPNPVYEATDPTPQSAVEWERRVNDAKTRIGLMCSEGRPPSMSIPIRHDVDDDMVITKLLDDALALAHRCDLAEDNARQSREEIEALKGGVAAMAENQGEWMRRAMAFEDKLAAAQAENERLRKGITEIKAGTRIGWFMTDLGAKCEKLLKP